MELSHGSRLRLKADLTFAGISLTMARRFPLGGRPGRLSRTWGRTPTVGIVHKVIFKSPETQEGHFLYPLLFFKIKSTLVKQTSDNEIFAKGLNSFLLTVC